jgi:hypothetical protein
MKSFILKMKTDGKFIPGLNPLPTLHKAKLLVMCKVPSRIGLDHTPLGVGKSKANLGLYLWGGVVRKTPKPLSNGPAKRVCVDDAL